MQEMTMMNGVDDKIKHNNNNHTNNNPNEHDEEEEELSFFGSEMFEEPKDFRPPTPPPQTLTVVLTPTLHFSVNLIGEHSLWAHCLWNSSRCISKWFTAGNTANAIVRPNANSTSIDLVANPPQPDYPIIHTNEHLGDQSLIAPIIAGKSVMELGAGGALPSMTCLFLGAKRVLCTDYPEKKLLDYTEQTFIDNFGREQYDQLVQEGTVEIRGHLWGNEEQLKQRNDCIYDELGRFVRRDAQNGAETMTKASKDTTEKFDIIILSDLIFNTSTHWEMMTTVRSCSIPEHTEIYLTYSHHRPHKKQQELKAFVEAKYLGIEFELLFIEKYPPMFPDDPYPLEEREKVWMWRGKVKKEEEE